MIREPAVAGRFYPDHAHGLAELVDGYLGHTMSSGPIPRAVIAPHAGFTFSGAVAGVAFRNLLQQPPERAIVIGPSHYVAFDGVALSAADAFATPIGDAVVDKTLRETIESNPHVKYFEPAHDPEHSIETHLPFLKRLNPKIRILPIVTGRISDDDLAEIIDAIWHDDVLLSVSTDLSHFEDDASARAHDAQTAERIRTLDTNLESTDACGATAVRGALTVARRRAMTCEVIELRNSSDAGAPRDRVVGYGAFGIFE